MIYDSVLITTNNDLCLWHGTMYIRTSSSYEKPFYDIVIQHLNAKGSCILFLSILLN